MEDVKVYSVEEVAEQLKLTSRSIYTYISEKKIKAVKIGKRWFISQDELNKIKTIGLQ